MSSLLDYPAYLELLKNENKLPDLTKVAEDLRPKPFAHPVSPTSLLSSVGRHIGMMFRENPQDYQIL